MAGFADVIAACGVWLGGRRAASSVANPPPSSAGIPVRWPGNVHRRYDPEILRIVHEAIAEETSRERAATKPQRDEAPPPAPGPTPFTLSDADKQLREMVNALFQRPEFGALDVAKRTEAETLTLDALRFADPIYSSFEGLRMAADADDEETMLLLM